MSDKPSLRSVLIFVWLASFFCLCRTQAQTEVYSWLFRNGDDIWQGAINGNRDEANKPMVRWETLSGNDTIGKGFAFSASECDSNDFLYIYKAFAGLKPNSYYEISTLASFTVGERTQATDQDILLKIGSTMSRPRVLASGNLNFSKGSGRNSGRNLQYIGPIHTGNDLKEHRFFVQNYDHPVLATTNHNGELYMIIGLEPSEKMEKMPKIYLNSLRVLFDLIGQDSSLARQGYKIDITKTEKPNVFAYHIFPEESILGYHVFSNEGHLIWVEEDSDCAPDCPRIIEADILDKGEYFIEFVLMNQDHIIKKIKVE